MRLVRFLLLLSAITGAIRAQTVQWSAGQTGDPADLQLVFENCVPEGQPALPALAEASLSFAGRSEQTSIINFSVTRSVALNYRLRSRAGGQVEIPAFTVPTDKGELRVPAYTTGALRQAPEVNIHARLQPGQTSLWAGELFPLNYTLDVSRRTFSQLGSPLEWDATPLVAEDWSKPEAVELTSGGETRLNIIYRSRAYARTPGNITLNAADQLVNIVIGVAGFGLFQQPRIEQVAVSTDQPRLTVRPLPPAPAGFSGAVGQFKLESKVVPATATVGEPITWTLELTGAGNWPDIAGLPAREVSRDFQVIQPQARRTPAEGKLFDVTLTEDVVLMPTRPGTYTLAPVSFHYFDPKAGEYKTLTTPPTTLTVTAAATSPFGTTPTATDPIAITATPERPPAPPTPPALPAAIPRDPLGGHEPAARPFASRGALITAVLAPIAALLAFWLALAVRRAHATDPARPQREARARLAATLQRLRHGQNRTALLLAWQHDTAQLWQIAHAAPPATAFTGPAAADWTRLWQEADKTLYGADAELPADWISRAEAALAAKKIRGHAPWRALLPRNLLPFLFTLIVTALLGLPTSMEAGQEAYQKGDFATAEKAWRKTVATKPTDWIARHNLALALAQQERWPEAAAHATAAFVQNPGTEASRWNLALCYDRAAYTPAPLAPFLNPGPRELLARHASPARWEHLLVAASTLIALALGWLLLTAYAPRARWTNYIACTGLALGVVLAAAALVSRAAYGPAGHPAAALVWRGTTLRSIPTEAETTQQTTSLAAGSIGIQDRTFLGWTRLSFPNGQTGWVRQDDLVPLWK